MKPYQVFTNDISGGGSFRILGYTIGKPSWIPPKAIVRGINQSYVQCIRPTFLSRIIGRRGYPVYRVWTWWLWTKTVTPVVQHAEKLGYP